MSIKSGETVISDGNSIDYESTKNIEIHHSLPLWRRLAFSVGGIPMQLMQNISGFFLSLFLLEVVDLPPEYLSAVLLVSRVVDAFTDPVMGYLVLKTHSRFGQKRPWMMFSTPTWVFSFFFLYYAVNASPGAKLAMYLILNCLLQIGLTAYQVPYSSLTMVLTTDPKERDVLTAFRMFSEAMAILLGVGVFGSIISPFRTVASCEDMNTGQMSNLSTLAPSIIARNSEIMAYKIAAAVTCIIGALSSIVCFFGTKEVATSAQAGEEDNEDRSLRGFFRTACKIFTFKPYLFHMGFFMFFSLAVQFCQSNLALYVTYSIKLTKYLTYGIMSLLLATILLIPVAQILLKKIGKKWTSTIAILNAYPLLAVLYFLPERLHLAVFFFMMIWFSITLSVGMLLPWSMLPDVIDAFELEYGYRSESVFYSVIVFCNKLAVGAAVSISAGVLGVFGYDSVEQCNQPPSVGYALRLISSIVPIVLLTPSLFCLYYYPLNTTTISAIRAKKAERAESPLKDVSRSNSVNAIMVDYF